MNKKSEDLLLQFTVGLGTETGGLNITIYVGGTLITGQLARRSVFFRRSFVDTASNDEVREAYERSARQLEESEREYDALRAKDDDELTKEERKVLDTPWRYINLVEAAVYIPGVGYAPTDRNGTFRIRTDAIGAWQVGSFDVVSS